MGSTWKTFTPAEVLTAQDVNDALNPATADHIPRAVASGTLQIPIAANTTAAVAANVTLPPGRFTSPPVVTLTAVSSLPGVVLTMTGITTTTVNVRAFLTSPNAGSLIVTVNWIAVQA